MIPSGKPRRGFPDHASVFLELRGQLLGNDRNLPGAVRHEEDDEEGGFGPDQDAGELPEEVPVERLHEAAPGASSC